MDTTYLDWAATAVPDSEIYRECQSVALSFFANPSSIHTKGREAEEMLRTARESCATILRCRPEQLVFTSGGTESNNIAIFSFLFKKKPGDIVVSSIEHPAVYEPCRQLHQFGFRVSEVNPQKSGIVDPHRFAAKVSDSTMLASLMYVNNETGAIQPINETCRIIRARQGKRPIHIHTDAVQAAGKIPIALDKSDVDSLSISSHKLGAPKGAGLLFLRKPIETIYRGGGQEKSLRPGTENIAAIWGLSLALKKWTDRVQQSTLEFTELKGMVVNGLKTIPGCIILPEADVWETSDYSPFILTAAVPPFPGEALVRMLSDRGVFLSTGSACSAKSQRDNRVLRAMGVSEQIASCSIRISWGHSTTREELKGFLSTLATAIEEGR